MTSSNAYYIGVDVGTSSVRAALITGDGKLIATSSQPLKIWEPLPDYYEQSSEDIWKKCCRSVQLITQGLDTSQIRGIGFDATCSLVVLDKQGKPLRVSQSGPDDMNIIMWMDHRATEQADRINATNHEVLKYVGGKISVEMQTPKLLWIKENVRDKCWDRAEHFMDLPDFLTWRATGSLSRSLCSLLCKWTYQCNASNHGWNEDFFNSIGLSELCTNSFHKIGSIVKSPGEPCGNGLTSASAAELGLKEGTPVGSSLIDAHAGGLGSIGCSAKQTEDSILHSIPQTSRLVLICGTSTCHMAVSSEPVFVNGVWGPYYSAMVPDLWLNEGGQSATGKLVDHIVQNHPSYSWLVDEAKKKDVHIHTVLNDVLDFMRKQKKLDNTAELTHDLHVWPDYHGNRSPLADPTLKGMVSGLSLSAGMEDLACQYLATIQALAYGTKEIIDAMVQSGYDIQLLILCGGLSKNPVYLQTHADVTGLPILLPDVTESVLLGAAILGASASGDFPSIQAALVSMAGEGTVSHPDPDVKQYHRKKYEVFLKMVDHQRLYKSIMAS